MCTFIIVKLVKCIPSGTPTTYEAKRFARTPTYLYFCTSILVKRVNRIPSGTPTTYEAKRFARMPT